MHAAHSLILVWNLFFFFLFSYYLLRPIMRHSGGVVRSVKCTSHFVPLLCHFAPIPLNPPRSPLLFNSHLNKPFFLLLLLCFQKMLLSLLPVMALLLSAQTALSANSNDKWPSTVAQYGKDRSWNRFRDVSLHGETRSISPKGQVIIGFSMHACVRLRACVCLCMCKRAGEKERAPLIHPVST